MIGGRSSKKACKEPKIYFLFTAPHTRIGPGVSMKRDTSVPTACEGRERRIFCVKRKEIPVPSPLSHLQAVADETELVKVLIEIYRQNKIDFDAGDLRARVKCIGSKLFGKIAELRGYSRVLVSINNDDFDGAAGLPAKGDRRERTPTTITNYSAWPRPAFSGLK